jgi:hypothetical protein
MAFVGLPLEIIGILRQYAGPRPATKVKYDAVLKQMRRKRAFKKIRKHLNWNHVAYWTDPRIHYVYLDTDERRRYAEISHELLIQQALNGEW